MDWIKEIVSTIWKRLQTAQSRQKSYTYNHRRPLEFNIGDHVFLKVYPLKGSVGFGQKVKLAPLFIRPFEILQRVGPIAYRLALPPTLQGIHDIFRVSNLCGCVPNPRDVIQYEPLRFKENLAYLEEPVRILDRMKRILQNRTIPYVKVLWKHHQIADGTWEPERLCGRNTRLYLNPAHKI